MDWRVPLFDVDFGDYEHTSVSKVLKSGWLTQGDKTVQFELAFAKAIGVRNAIAVSSCTAALHLSLLALGLKPGDEVICPSLTFVATANAVRYVGATPIFCDIVSTTNFNIDPVDIERKLTDRTRAILVVHFAGYPADMHAISKLATSREIPVVEDVAHACISTLDSQACGSIGACGCFSFFSNKNMTSGEGGAITTNDDELAEKLRLLRSHGMTTSTIDRHKGHAYSYDVICQGYNYRIDEIRSSILMAQLERLPSFLELRRQHVSRYRELLIGTRVGIPDFSWNEIRRDDDVLAPHIMPVLLPEGIDRKKLMKLLRDKGIQSSIHYPPVHQFTSFRNKASNVSLPITELVATRSLTLPLYPSMTAAQIELVCSNLIDGLNLAVEIN